MSMDKKPYYLAYENRYKTVFEAGADHWGHTPNDKVLIETLEKWVAENNLTDKKIIEFACGVILSQLGCCYQGVDIAPSAVHKTTLALKKFPNAKVDILDMVKDTTGLKYDAALDCMGFHMLVTDSDRKAYLENAFNSLSSKCPMLFFRESFRNDNNKETIYKGIVHSYEEWKEITAVDYETPSVRRVSMEKGDIEVMLPLLPARANDKDGYTKEMESVGFIVEDFVEMQENEEITYSASIYVRKP